MIYYRQCQLKKGSSIMVSWVPEEFCIEGKFLKLKDHDKEWEDGWKVICVSENRVDDPYLRTHERDYLTQRKASDI